MKTIITESQLKQMIKETVRRVLNEGKDANQLADTFVRKNPNIDKNGLIKLLMADPTASQNDRGSFAGKYGVWIGNMYANGGIKPGDAPELKSALFTYDKNKTQLPQIKDCKSLSELIEWVKDLSDDFKPVRKQSKAKADLEKVYEDDEWVVYVPHSHAAARRGGEGTHWCTASENDYYYNMYSKDGPLYINIRKSDGAKFQFHFETEQFMDADDEPIQLNEIGLSEGLISFYSKIDPKFKFRLKFDWVGDFIGGVAGVTLNGKRNFINTEGQLVSKQWFDWADIFKEGFALVILNGKRNFINTEGQILSKQWFEYVDAFNDGFAAVRLNGKWNFINTEGQFLSNQWFDNGGDFNEGFAKVKLNGKYNFINPEGRLLSTPWFDDAWKFKEGFAIVRINDKRYNLDKEGNLTLRESRRIISPTITESQLRNIIKEAVRRVLKEGKDVNQLADTFVRKNPNIDKNGLIKLLMADPTASQNDRGSFAGKYGVWIGNMYANGGIKPGDAPELKSALFTYDKNKTQLPQIKDCKSLSELIEWVKDLSDDFKPVRKQSKAKADLEKVYEDDEWVVYVPHSHAAARRGGEGTHWCTASENDYYYNYYSKDGPLYINIRKSDGAKFQFHFESNQFMDTDDDPVSLKEIGLSDGLINFYSKISPLFKLSLKYDFIDEFVNGFALVGLNGEWNLINHEGQLISKQWFDHVTYFIDGFAKVMIKGMWNFIKTDGQLLSKYWFDDIKNFQKGFARVRIYNLYNFIGENGLFLSKQWFDAAGDFNGDFAIVKLDGKDYTLDTKGNLTLRESRRSLSPIITESILKRIKSECIKRLMDIK